MTKYKQCDKRGSQQTVRCDTILNADKKTTCTFFLVKLWESGMREKGVTQLKIKQRKTRIPVDTHA